MVRDNRKKTNLIINPKFQFPFIIQLFLLMVSLYGVVILVANWLISPLIEQINTLNLPANHHIWIVIDNFNNYAGIMAILLFLVFSCFFITASLIISHRIVGPLRNLQNAMARMGAAKKLTKIYFRKNDHFKDLEGDFNNMVDEFQRD